MVRGTWYVVRTTCRVPVRLAFRLIRNDVTTHLRIDRHFARPPHSTTALPSSADDAHVTMSPDLTPESGYPEKLRHCVDTSLLNYASTHLRNWQERASKRLAAALISCTGCQTGMWRMGKRAVTWIAIVTIGVLVPLLLLALLGLTPDSKLREGPAGSFISSTTSGGGFLSGPVSTVQTTTGSVAVYGPVSALHGQRLWVEDRLKSGLALCVDGSPPACTKIAGRWNGPLRTVQYEHHVFTPLAASITEDTLARWFLWGLLWSFVAGVFMLCLGSISMDVELDAEGSEK